MLTPEDKDLLVKKGISEQQIAEQLACFEKGFHFVSWMQPLLLKGNHGVPPKMK